MQRCLHGSDLGNGMIELIDKHNELADAFIELEEDVEEIEGAIQ